MRIAIVALLAAFCLATPGMAATDSPLRAAEPAAKRAKPVAQRATAPARTDMAQAGKTLANTAQASRARSAAPRVRATRHVAGKTGRAGAGKSARTYTRGVEGAHPGLGDTDFRSAAIEAGGFCGQMLMPAAELRQISRGMQRGHTGIDLMAPKGTPVHAAAAGSVIYAGWYYAYGNIVDIRHADGVVTRYAHMSSFAPEVSAGQPVAAGEEIGKVGATGHATGPHVHFEVRVGGRPVDPRPYLALAGCGGASPASEILEAYAGEERPAPAKRPLKRARQANSTRAR